VILSFSVADARAGFVTSTFDSDAEGWTTFNDANALYSSTFGNPAGSFEGIDRVNSVVWYFDAPAKFLGDQSSNFGAPLSYDIWVSDYNPANTVVGDVVIRGNGLQLKWREAAPVADAWTTQTVILDSTGGWERSADDVPATEAELRLVLSNLQFLRIRGEYHSGPDHGFLDNVTLGTAPAPEPSSVALANIGLMGVIAGALQNRRKAIKAATGLSNQSQC
jgi:hypothetical protein